MGGKHGIIFLILDLFLAYQSLRIVGSQIEIKMIFFFSRHTYKPKEMLLTIRQFREINFSEQKLTKQFLN
jgi:hypothetical protein